MNRARTKFLLDHDLTHTSWYERQTIEQLYRWYDAIAYNPQSNTVDDMWEFDEDDPNLVPKDLVHHDPDIDQIDLTTYDDTPDNATGVDYVRLPYGTNGLTYEEK